MSRRECERQVALVRSGTAGDREEAAGALWNLAYDAANRVAIAAAGAIPPLVALVTNGAAGGQEAAARALADFTSDDEQNEVAVVVFEDGGLAALVELVANGTAGAQEHAARALGNLACELCFGDIWLRL